MRVAVHHPARTNADGEAIPESVSAFRLGRITDFVNPLTGETTPAEDVAAKLLADAKAAHPDCEVVLERLVHNGDSPDVLDEDGVVLHSDPYGEGGTSAWVHHEQVPAGSVSPKGSVIQGPELTVEQPQEAS